jgi:hypothetical protein
VWHLDTLRFYFLFHVGNKRRDSAKRHTKQNRTEMLSGKDVGGTESVGEATAARRALSRRGARKRARARLQRRVLVVLFAMSLPVVSLLLAAWMAWLRGDMVVEVSFV